jgi:putative PIN family toxin of toxin-antitoxin system
VIRAVVDTSVLVSAFVGDPDAGPGQLVEAWREQRFELVVSAQLLAELREVLTRPKLARWADDGRAEAYVEAFAAQSVECADAEEPPPSAVRDPGDDYLVDLLHRSGADVLVSVDRDLLDAQLAGVTVLDPAQFLARVASHASDPAA